MTLGVMASGRGSNPQALLDAARDRAAVAGIPAVCARRWRREWGSPDARCTSVTPDLDAGPILMQASVPVEAGDTEEALSARILVEEHKILVETVRTLEREQLNQQTERVQGVAR